MPNNDFDHQGFAAGSTLAAAGMAGTLIGGMISGMRSMRDLSDRRALAAYNDAVTNLCVEMRREREATLDDNAAFRSANAQLRLRVRELERRYALRTGGLPLRRR